MCKEMVLNFRRYEVRIKNLEGNSESKIVTVHVPMINNKLVKPDGDSFMTLLQDIGEYDEI